MAVISQRGVAAGRAGGDVTSGRNNPDVSQREDLANFISMITRDETPFMSSIGKTKATAIYHEWQTDALSAPGNSRVSEGLDYVLPTAQPGVAGTQNNQDGQFGAAFAQTGLNRTRLGNYCQINGKTIAVSGTRRAIDQAGVADEYAYQLKKRGTELRRDIEHDLLMTNQVASAGTGSTLVASGSDTGARSLGGYSAWINDPATVEVVGSTSLPASGSRGIGTSAPTNNATKGSLSLTDVDQVMQKIYQEGGKANKIMVSPKLRRDFSDLMVSDTGVRRNLDEKGKLRQSVDVYMSDFGDLMVVPNYIMGLSTGTGATEFANWAALIYDPMWFSMATLRPLQEVDVGQRGDSTIGMMVEEFTMEVKNPLGCGAIYGLN